MGSQLATSPELMLATLQEQVVAALRVADANHLYDIAAHLDAAHQLIADHMREMGLATYITEVAPPLDDLA